MNNATGAAIQSTTTRSRQIHTQNVDAPRLPRWEDLPPEHHHELVMVLSMIMVKRLLVPQEGNAEVTRE
jgi:hypothetical protein